MQDTTLHTKGLLLQLFFVSTVGFLKRASYDTPHMSFEFRRWLFKSPEAVYRTVAGAVMCAWIFVEYHCANITDSRPTSSL
jgi:hypothetical protein